MAGMMCVVAGFVVSLSAPRGRINRKYTFLRRILLVHDVPEGASRASNVAENGLFEVWEVWRVSWWFEAAART